MNGVSLTLLLITIIWLVHSHIILEEKQERRSSIAMARFPEILPPIIVDLKKSSRRVSRVDAEQNKLTKKKEIPKKKPQRLPPPNCVPLKSSCKPPAPSCCEPCAFCYCHIFQTVCVYRMGNPNC
ncbi:agouti-signaling protein-like [Aquarana catesbeiana]|uniref:agouti-signaling protein-like n=1 Tax=Aquarana catesbeiana TaxID=8400 RepID=UPI003CC9D71A